MGRASISILTAVVLSALLAACGVRGNLERPGSTSVTPSTARGADAGVQGEAKSSASVAKPHKSSVLDGLLR